MRFFVTGCIIWFLGLVAIAGYSEHVSRQEQAWQPIPLPGRP